MIAEQLKMSIEYQISQENSQSESWVWLVKPVCYQHIPYPLWWQFRCVYLWGNLWACHGSAMNLCSGGVCNHRCCLWSHVTLKTNVKVIATTAVVYGFHHSWLLNSNCCSSLLQATIWCVLLGRDCIASKGTYKVTLVSYCRVAL